MSKTRSTTGSRGRKRYEVGPRLIACAIVCEIARAMLFSIANAREPRGAEITDLAASPAVVERVLQLVNRARLQGRRCGREWHQSTSALAHSATLEKAARIHADDMAANTWFEHRGFDGSSPTQRLARTGYLWRLTGENIAYGPTSADEVVNGWLGSPGHCANIMDPRFSEMGVAYAFGRTRGRPLYWAQTLAAPHKLAPSVR